MIDIIVRLKNNTKFLDFIFKCFTFFTIVFAVLEFFSIFFTTTLYLMFISSFLSIIVLLVIIAPISFLEKLQIQHKHVTELDAELLPDQLPHEGI